MDKLTILFFVSTLALAIGLPAKLLVDTSPDDFFGANSLDADPISSEQAEQYKQELLRQQKLQQELLLEAQRVTTQILQNTEKTVTDKKEVEDDIVIASTSTAQPEEVHTVTTGKEKISTTTTTSTTTPPTTHFTTASSTNISSTSAPSSTINVFLRPIRPQRNPQPGGMLSRIIDDIFQIPISVIQSVARLLRNPFTPRRTPETTLTY